MYLALAINPNFRIKMINKISNLFLDNKINKIKEILIHNLIKTICFKLKIKIVNLEFQDFNKIKIILQIILVKLNLIMY